MSEFINYIKNNINITPHGIEARTIFNIHNNCPENEENIFKNGHQIRRLCTTEEIMIRIKQTFREWDKIFPPKNQAKG